RDPSLMQILAQRGTTLEICPTSNLRTHAVADLDELKSILWRFKDHGVGFTINTDGPEMLGTTLREEYRLLLRNGILDLDHAGRANTRAPAASFLNRAPVPGPAGVP